MVVYGDGTCCAVVGRAVVPIRRTGQTVGVFVLQQLWQREPVRVATALAAIVVFIAAQAGVVITQQDVLPTLLVLLPLIAGGEVVRKAVTPAAVLDDLQPPRYTDDLEPDVDLTGERVASSRATHVNLGG